MKNDPQFRAGRIAWMFKKSGAEGERTRLFEGFSAETQEQISKAAELRPGEVPVLAHVSSLSEWVLATSERVIWIADERLASLAYGCLKDATVDPGDLLRARSKGGLAVLTLKSLDGSVHKLALEAGEPFSGFWNALKMMAQAVSG